MCGVCADYGVTLADTMNFFQLTIFVPLDLTIYDGMTSNWWLVQRLALHTVLEEWDPKALEQAPVGTKVLHCHTRTILSCAFHVLSFTGLHAHMCA